MLPPLSRSYLDCVCGLVGLGWRAMHACRFYDLYEYPDQVPRPSLQLRLGPQKRITGFGNEASQCKRTLLSCGLQQ